MFINKIGYQHVEMGINNQDFGFEIDNIKCVVDGCSEGLHSEVGAKLFCHLFKKCENDIVAFADLITILDVDQNDIDFIKNYLLFTILCIEEDDDKFIVSVCGDGIIIKQKHNDLIEYEKIDYSGAPPYFAYNFINQERLSKYKDGVDFQVFEFFKSEYKSIGVASDGLNYIIDSIFKDEFEELLIKRKEAAIKRLINREHKLFKDDITIVI